MKHKQKYIRLLILTILLGSSACQADNNSGKEKPPAYVIKNYMAMNSFPEKGDLVEENKIEATQNDFNGDGLIDWFLTDPMNCGSMGCQGSIYIAVKKMSNDTTYCYAGTVHEDAVKMNNLKLNCEKDEKYIEIPRKIRPYG